MAAFEIKQLEYFVRAAKAGSISRAAESMAVSQQALSKGVRSLESVLGVQLLARSPSGVSLTSHGEQLMEDAKAVLEALGQCEQHAAAFAQSARATIRVGISSFCFDERGGTLNARKLADFQHKHEDIDFVFKEIPAFEVGQAIVSDDVDFGIAPIDDPSGTLASVLLADYQMAVIMSKHSPLSAYDTVAIRSLDKGKVVLPSGNGNGRESYLAPFFKMIQARNNPASMQIECSDASELVSDDETFVVRPMQHALRTTSTKRVAIRPLVNDEGKPALAPLSLSWKKSRSLSNTDRTFVNSIVSLYRATH